MNVAAERLRVTGVLTAVLIVVSGCGDFGGGADDAPGLAPTSATSSAFTVTTAEKATSQEIATPTSTPLYETPHSPAAPTPAIVTEGAECGPRGALAVFADGVTAYCARLQYTDGAAWSRDPQLAPNPAVEEAMRQSGPRLGAQCMGADIGRRAVDASGVAILCDNYVWRQDVGQEPRHPWVDDQVRWMECLEHSTEKDCRDLLDE
ncbi:hypothetical protein ACTHQW_05620 [Dietzia maris]